MNSLGAGVYTSKLFSKMYQFMVVICLIPSSNYHFLFCQFSQLDVYKVEPQSCFHLCVSCIISHLGHFFSRDYKWLRFLLENYLFISLYHLSVGECLLFLSVWNIFLCILDVRKTCYTDIFPGNCFSSNFNFIGFICMETFHVHVLKLFILSLWSIFSILCLLLSIAVRDSTLNLFIL